MKPNILLRRERERRGWSQARIAEKLGVDTQTVSRWERGKSHPYPHMREQLCTLFDKDPEALGLVRHDLLTTNKADDTPFQFPKPLIDPVVPLPLSEMQLIGREKVYAQLKVQLLQSEQQPGGIAIICGLPGVGKTTLVTALAHDADIQAHFADGVLWASAGPAPDTTETMMRWHDLFQPNVSYRPKEEQHAHYWAQAVHSQVSQRRILLILDDIWDLETLQALRLGGYHCFHMITTRMPQVALHFAPNTVWTVPELTEQESINLLTHYLSRPEQQDRELFRALAHAVGGLPLALSLIGRHLRAQSATNQPRRLQAAIQRVGDPASRLQLSEPQTLITHHPYLSGGTLLSLETVIAVSEQHLTIEARQALHLLSFFPPKPNSFSEDLALVISQLPLTVFDELYDRGLIESPEPSRYQLHSTIADYAQWHHREATMLPQWVERLIRYLEEHSTDYNTLELEHRNQIAILELALREKLSTAYIRGVQALVGFWEIRGLYPLALEHLQHALQFARNAQNSSMLMALLAHLGQIARRQNQRNLAEGYLNEGLHWARQLSNNQMISHFLINLAELSEQRRAFVQAYDYLREGLALSCHLRHEERTHYHRMTSWIGETNICVYFTEPQQMLQRGYLADIDSLFQGWQNAYHLAPQWLDVVRGPDRHIYGIPIHCYDLCLIYNRRLFREAELDPDQPPTTWHDFRLAAKRLTNPQKDIYGFAEATIYNAGGWRFTNWLYSAGGDAETCTDGFWRATFHNQRGVALLEMLKEMRFSDQSMPKAALLSATALGELFCNEKIAMYISGSSTLNELYHNEHLRFEDIGIGPMPQQGGNACLVGGLAHVFNKRIPPEMIQETFQQVVTEHFPFDLQRYQRLLQSAHDRKEPVGLPGVSLFTEAFQRQIEAMEATFVNVPQHQYQTYLQSKLTPRLEPPHEAQNYYALIDPILQTVLTDPHAPTQRLLNTAAQQFQERYLDRLNDTANT